MDAYLQKILTEIGFYLPGYQKGIISGAVAIIAIIILFYILLLIFNKNRRCPGVVADDEHGGLFITSQAISDLIKALESEFDGITICKTQLFRKRSKYSIKLIAELDSKDINFPHLMTKIRERIIDALGTGLGVTSVENVDIHLRRVKANF